jgi:predicted AAA+ superfamily ATPase
MLERTLKKAIEELSQGFRVILLTGQRQVGKTTLLSSMAQGGRRIISLDDLRQRQLAQNDPELFLAQNPPPVLIDEVQYAPQLFPSIKIYVDNHKDEKGAFWLTGSQKFSLMKGIRESLAGRIAIVDMMGLSYREKMGAALPGAALSGRPFLPPEAASAKAPAFEPLSPDRLYQSIWEGSLPELVTDKRLNRETFYSSYIQSYIERDVRDFYSIEKPVQFFNFITACAARTGNLINYSSIANDIGIDVKTAQTWMGLLERAGLVYLLRPYSPNVTRRIVRSPKLYFLDTGLCSYLSRWETPQSLDAGAMDGAILETWCLAEILKSYVHAGKEPQLYFYRDADQKEIDFILEQDMTLFPVEVKKSASPGAEAIRNFSVLSKLGKKVGPGAVLCLTPKAYPLSREVTAIPAWEI